MAQELQLTLLGNPEVHWDGALVTDLSSKKALALLCYLAVTGRPHLRPSLVGLLWGEMPENLARNNLSKALTHLRRAVGPYLCIAREQVAFNRESAYWLDVEQFERAVQAQSMSAGADIERLARAVDLYRGDFLAGFYVRHAPAFEEWVLVQRARLRELALQALHALAAYYAGQGEAGHAAGIDYTTRLLALEPWREEAHRQLMALLAGSGQRGGALAQYETCCQVLAKELSVEPGPETVALYNRIRDGEAACRRQEEIAMPDPAMVTAPPPPALPSAPAPASAAPTGERRRVAVLHAEVAGSAALLDEVGPERWTAALGDVLQMLESAVQRYGGEVHERREGGLVALFGVPVAHEDDAERAILAALAVQEQMAAYTSERPNSHLALCMGVDSGELLIAQAEDRRQAVGRALTLAQRAKTNADPGAVLVGENAYRLVRALFEWERPGQGAAQGLVRPLARRADQAKGRGIEGLSSPLVGRDVEFLALRKAIERLQDGVGSIVTVVGEAGIGKSRLVAQTRKFVADSWSASQSASQRSPNLQSPRWVEGRCLSYCGSIAYLLWLDVLRGLLEVRADAPPHAARDALWKQVQALCPGRAADALPYLARLMALPLAEEDERVLRGLDGASLQYLTFRAVETLVECASCEQPLVVVCEDLHWADPTSVALLEQLLAVTDRAPLLLVCVFRPEMAHPCWQIKESAARRYRHRHIDLWLDPLAAAEGETLVENLLQAGGLPADLLQRILDHAEGNPFYVEEIIRSLIDNGTIVYSETTGRWRATQNVDDIALPDSLHGVLRARIDRLPGGSKRVLQRASVIGRVFAYRVLVEIAHKEPELDDRLLMLQRGQMIRERARVPEREYIFKHHLTQEAAYDGLLRRERRAIHRQVAEVLETLYEDDTTPIVAQLARHYARAGRADKAAEYLARAGDRARIAYAHQAAIDCYRQAVAFLKEQERYGEAARTLMKLGLTCHNAFRFAEARQAYEEGFALWQQAARTVPSTPLSTAPHALRAHGYYWGEPSTLDPAFAADFNSATAVSQLFSGLATLSPEQNVVPDIVQRWKLLEGGRTYVFHLRDDVHWSDGVPLTAGDFEFAWKRILDPVTESPGAQELYLIRGARAFHQGEETDPQRVGVRAADDCTLVVELEDPSSPLLYRLVGPYTLAVPRHVIQTHEMAWTEPERLVSSGPFCLAAWERNRSLILERSPIYHGSPVGNVERVQLLFGSKHDANALELYEQDQLDVLDLRRMPLIVQDRARQQHAAEFILQPIRGVIVAGLNVSQPPLNDRRVRRALVLAVDRERLADVVYGGLQFPATGGLWPPGTAGHSPGIALPYDPERARRLLAEAGYPDGYGFPTIEALGIAKSTHLHAVEYLQAQWLENLGIDFSCQLVEIGEWVKRMKPGSSVPKPLIWYVDANLGRSRDDQVHSILEGWWFTSGWQNKAYRRLEEASRRAVDPQERLRICREADQILVEEAPTIILMYQRMGLLVKPWVTRLPLSASGGTWWKDVVIEPH